MSESPHWPAHRCLPCPALPHRSLTATAQKRALLRESLDAAPPPLPIAGCPQRAARREHFGSALLTDPTLVDELVWMAVGGPSTNQLDLPSALLGVSI